jgi:hypothetical protein
MPYQRSAILGARQPCESPKSLPSPESGCGLGFRGRVAEIGSFGDESEELYFRKHLSHAEKEKKPKITLNTRSLTFS